MFLFQTQASKTRQNTKDEKLLNACESGDLARVTQAVANGADVNAKPPGGFTPLFVAVRNKHIPITTYLLTKGARVDEKSGPYGQSALHKASVDGSLEIVKLLVDANADVNLKTAEGYASLFVAVQNKHIPIITYLLTKGAYVDEKSGPHGLTALYKACSTGSLEILKLLVDANADVNLKSTEGFASLYIAVQTQHIPIITYLLTKGAYVDEKSGPNGLTALHKASADGSLEIVKLLLNAGANPNILNHKGETPLDFAIKKNHPQIVEYLESLSGPPKPEPDWTGFTQSDISKFDTIFETEASPGQLPPAINYACCPVCLKFVERSEACMYMSHQCSDYYHKALYSKYKNPEGKIHWCTICGRICSGHRHYIKTYWNAPKPELMPSGDPFENDCKNTSGGGGLEEKLARFRTLRNTAWDLQAALNVGESYTMTQVMNELVEQCWNASPGLFTKRIMTKKAWNRPTSNFPSNKPPNNAKPTFVYPKDDPSAYEAPRIIKPGNANFSANIITGEDSEPVVQFKHKNADGSMYVHPFINKETLLMFLSGSGSDWPCFDKACGGHLWPAEVIQALDNPAFAATAEEKAKAQAYKERVHGQSQNAGHLRIVRQKKTRRQKFPF